MRNIVLGDKFDIRVVSQFISDGRKETLKKAVSFLIAQYKLQNEEERKFLVIRDKSSKEIELWIAAIEYAFSPRIAASIPFATRLDRFATSNRYTVNQLGMYINRTQINLQDRKQKKRWQAMIVGIDKRDEANSAAARPLANSPFVLLDGIEKCIMHDNVDISHGYYELITSFDDSHAVFCREFLQMLNINNPCEDIYRLYEVYTVLVKPDGFPLAKSVAEKLSIMRDIKDNLVRSNLHVFKKFLYSPIRKEAELRRFLQVDLHSALEIIEWVKETSPLVGDNTAKRDLTDIVCKAFADQVYENFGDDAIFMLWDGIQKSVFGKEVAGHVASLPFSDGKIKKMKRSAQINLVFIHLECALFADKKDMNLNKFVNLGIELYAQDNDGGLDEAEKMLGKLLKGQKPTVKKILPFVATAIETDKKNAKFITKLLIRFDNSIIASTESMWEFLGLLNRPLAKRAKTNENGA